MERYPSTNKPVEIKRTPFGLASKSINSHVSIVVVVIIIEPWVTQVS